MNPLLARQCRAAAAALGGEAIAALLPLVPSWSLQDGKLCRSFAFRNYYETISFVNALAWMTHQQDHHPELRVTYNGCAVSYHTHSVRALSENDFICAARADALYAERAGA